MASTPQLQRVHDLVTLDRLVALVDRQLAAPVDDPLARIQLDATLRRAQELVDSLSSSSPHPAASSSARPPQLDQLAARLARAHARAAALPRSSSDRLAAVPTGEPAAPTPLAALLDALGPAKPVTPLDALPWPPAASTSALPSPAPPVESVDHAVDAPPHPSAATAAAGTSERSALAALTPPAPAPAPASSTTPIGADSSAMPALAPTGSRLRARRTAPTSASRPTSTTSAATSADEADATPSSSVPPSPTRRTLALAPSAAPGDDKPVPAYLAAKRARARDKALRAAADEEARLEEERAAEERERGEREERERREREEREAGRGRLGLRLRGRGGKGKEKETQGEKGKKGATSARDELLPVGSSTPGGAGADLASYHASEQASLLGALSSLSSTLKASTLEFSTLLERDKEVLEAAEGKLERSEGQMSKEGKRLEGVRKKGRGTTCATLGILAVVAVLWVLVFLLIKVT
ncbi:hypothetical protein JCM8208_005208 [Rhodotorula glutinis]